MMHLYLHIPYCISKCPYCDFNSIAGRHDEHAAYVEALLTELRRLPPGPYDTIFMGGGTPTMLSAALLQRLLAGINAHLRLATGGEWTCESNPGVSDAERFRVLAAGGVNRISLGVQSTHAHHLAYLGRAHDRAAADRAVAAAQAVVPRVSCDLILGLPQQTPAELAADLDWMHGHGLRHVSVYHLAIEPGTEFAARHARGDLPVIDSERGRALLEQAWTTLAERGLSAYETSNFAVPGEESRHNLAYWLGRDYHAVGAGAVSTIAGRRVTRERHPARYIAAIQSGAAAEAVVEQLSSGERLSELWMLGLRLIRGVSRSALRAAGDRDERWLSTAQALAREGLLLVDDERVALTLRGRVVQDAVTVRLLPD
jgi:oxygen-independent coproporphyrinogen-3 oxidase